MYGGVSALGVCIGGHVDSANGTVVRSPHFNWTEPVPLARLIDEATGIPTFLENDVNALGLWEGAFGTHHLRDFALVLIGEGVGAAFLFDGTLFRGQGGGAGEIGHCVTLMPNPLDRTGENANCQDAIANYELEAITNYEAIRREAKKRRLGNWRVGRVVKESNNGNQIASDILVDAGTALGISIANLGSLVDPGTVIVSSTALAQSTVFRETVETTAARTGFSTTTPNVLWTQTEYRHAARGAAWTAMRNGPRRVPRRRSLKSARGR
jgi:predicted NBD/HSP70 family sugar kinase